MENKIIGNYRIVRLIGEGGMAKVYEAQHISIGNKVAIKILDPIFVKKDNLKERFIQEAKIMARLNHPFIVKVYDFIENEEDAFYAIVMEFLEGESLSQFIKSYGALSSVLTYDLMLKILNAFQYAHDKGLIHRDVKPSNIFITTDKNIKVLDFGIAKLEGQDAHLTGTGTQMGTPVYMSPEQVKDSKNLDNKSDIYSLGVLMFYMLSGKAPYDSGTMSVFDIQKQIVSKTLPEIETHSSFNEIIQRATRKKPEERFASIDEFIDALKKSKETRADTLRGKTKKNRQSLKTHKKQKSYKSLSIILTVVLVLFIILFFNQAEELERIKGDYYDYQITNSNLNDEISSLQSELNTANERFRDLQNKIKSVIKEYPVIITKIELGNSDGDGNLISEYGATLYSWNIKYLKPRIKYKMLDDKLSNVKLKIKIYEGENLRRGFSSPSGYSYTSSFTPSYTGHGTAEISGWGNSSGGTYDTGTYRIEIWYDDDTMLKAKTFYIY